MENNGNRLIALTIRLLEGLKARKLAGILVYGMCDGVPFDLEGASNIHANNLHNHDGDVEGLDTLFSQLHADEPKLVVRFTYLFEGRVNTVYIGPKEVLPVTTKITHGFVTNPGFQSLFHVPELSPELIDRVDKWS